jgi:DNA-binding MarR family transcriptional regulator
MPTPLASRSDAVLAGLLRDAVSRLGRRMRHHSPHPELSLGQLAALRSLEMHGAMTPRELAEREKVQPPSMTKILARLEETGYITRTPHAEDRRQVLLAPSKAGLDLLADDRRRRDAWIAQRLRALDPDEVTALRAALPVIEKLSRA